MSNSVSGLPYGTLYSALENSRNSLVKASNTKSKYTNTIKKLIDRVDKLSATLSRIRREEDMLATDIRNKHDLIKRNPDLQIAASFDKRIKSINSGLDSIREGFKILCRDVSIVLECVQEEEGGY